MRKSFEIFSKAPAFLAASLLCLGAANSRANSLDVDFSGTANQIYGTGNGVPNNAAVTGDITINPNNLTTVYETPNLAYYTGVGPVYNTINGTVTEYQDIDIYVAYNTTDLNNNPASGFAIYWGPNDSDGIVVYDSVNTIQDASLNSLGVMLSEGLTSSLPYQEDAFFGVGFDSSGFNGGQGNLATLSLTTVPSSVSEKGSPYELGLALGALGLGAPYLKGLKPFKRSSPSPACV